MTSDTTGDATGPAVVARDVHVRRGTRAVLHGVDFEAHRGRILAILGPNGAGKSTLLRALAGLLRYAGSVQLDGREIDTLDARERARHLSFVPQRSQLAAHLPVEAVVAQGRYAHAGPLSHPTAADRGHVRDAMARARVSHLAKRDFARLSYGEQRRVLLARALSTGAEALLLDEPAASLDIAQALELHAELRGLAAQGRCVVIVLHQLDDALRFADDAILLADGKRIAAGPVAEVLSTARIESVYGVTPRPGAGLAFERMGGRE